MEKKIVLSFFLSFVPCLFFLECGEDKEEKKPYTMIIGNNGGEVEGPDGSKLKIPHNALEKEFEFSIEKVEPPKNIPSDYKPTGEYFSFKPAEIQFKKMATIYLPFNPSAIPYGKSEKDIVVLITTIQETWQPLATTPQEGKISAATYHLGTAVPAVFHPIRKDGALYPNTLSKDKKMGLYSFKLPHWTRISKGVK